MKKNTAGRKTAEFIIQTSSCVHPHFSNSFHFRLFSESSPPSPTVLAIFLFPFSSPPPLSVYFLRLSPFPFFPALSSPVSLSLSLSLKHTHSHTHSLSHSHSLSLSLSLTHSLSLTLSLSLSLSLFLSLSLSLSQLTSALERGVCFSGSDSSPLAILQLSSSSKTTQTRDTQPSHDVDRLLASSFKPFPWRRPT